MPGLVRLTRSMTFALTAATVALLLVGRAPAAEKFGTSIDFVPADSAFYMSSMRLKETLEIVLNSKAFSRFKEIPAVAGGIKSAQDAWESANGPMSFAKTMIEMPENEQLIDLVKDMFSQEVFVVADKDSVKSLKMLNAINNAQRLGGMRTALRASAGGMSENSDKAMLSAILDAMASDPSGIKIPNIVIGHKITDPSPAKFQLRRLEVLAKGALQALGEDWTKRLKREKIDEVEYLTFTLEGSQIPWSEVRSKMEEMESEKGQTEKIVEAVKSQKVIVALGVRESYFIVSIGNSTELLTSLGKGPNLTTLSELKPVVAAKAKPLCSVGYISKPMAEALMFKSSDLDDLAKSAAGLLSDTDLPADERARIETDVKQFSADLKPLLPPPGAIVTYEYRTPTGFEGYGYNYTVNKEVDGSKKLDILMHAGGSPILAVAARNRYAPEHYELLAKWAHIAFGYVDKYAGAKMDEETKARYEKVKVDVKPLVDRAFLVTKSSLLPSLKDGQSGVIVDAKIVSKKWFEDMPESSDALPMAEIGLIVGVSDPAKFKAAMTEYSAIAEELVKVLKKDGKDFPQDFELPKSKKSAVGDAEARTFELPAEWNVDKQLAPTLVLGKDVAIFTTSPAQANRLIKSVSLANPIASAEASKPAAAMVHLDIAGLVKAASPWIVYAVSERINDDDATLDQLRTGLKLLECLQSVTATTTVEGDRMITHTQTIVKDVE